MAIRLARSEVLLDVGRVCLLGFPMLLLPLGLLLAGNEDRWDFAFLVALYLAMAG